MRQGAGESIRGLADATRRPPRSAAPAAWAAALRASRASRPSSGDRPAGRGGSIRITDPERGGQHRGRGPAGSPPMTHRSGLRRFSIIQASDSGDAGAPHAQENPAPQRCNRRVEFSAKASPRREARPQTLPGPLVARPQPGHRSPRGALREIVRQGLGRVDFQAPIRHKPASFRASSHMSEGDRWRIGPPVKPFDTRLTGPWTSFGRAGPEKTRETDLSTEQAGAQAPPRLPRPHGHQGGRKVIAARRARGRKRLSA